MRTFLRLAFLVSCGALGIGIAICLATSMESGPVTTAASGVAAEEPKQPPAMVKKVEREEPVHAPAVAKHESLDLKQPGAVARNWSPPELAEPPLPQFAPIPVARVREPIEAKPFPPLRQRIELTESASSSQTLKPAPTQLAAAPGLSGIDPAALQQMLQNPEMQKLLSSPTGQQMIKDQAQKLLGGGANAQLLDQIVPMLTGQNGAGLQLPGLGAQQVPAAGPQPLPVPQNTQPATPPQSATTATAPAQADDEPKTTIDGSEGDNNLQMSFRSEDLRKALEHLGQQGELNILTSSSVQGTVTATLRDVNVDQALDAILRSTGFIAKRDGKFVYVGTPQEFEAMKTATDTIGTRVYRPNYVTAKELQTLITPLLSQGVGKSSVTTPSDVGIATNSSAAGGDNFASGEAVLVQDYEAILAQVDQVVSEIDRRPLQVAIEAMILSVTLNDSNKFGVDLQLLKNQPDLRFGSGTPRTDPLSGTGTTNPATGGIINEFTFPAPGGLKFAFMDQSLGAFITALETIGDTNVIATPRLLCLNKQKAEILIGSQIGYTTTTVTQTFSTQTVQFLEVGTQLRLRPFISADGTIRMEVHPELSNAGASTNGVPSKNVTQVTTNIMCPDGCTVVLGGLMQETLQTNTNQIPVLGSLPGVGWMFRTRNDSIVRQEVLVLITPRIVYEPEFNQDSAKEKADSYRRQAVKEDHMSRLSRTEMSSRYLRRAQEAMAAGDTRHARKFSELAVFFDPNNADAIALRSQFDQEPAEVELVPSQVVPPQAGGPNGAINGNGVAPWVLDDLQGKRSAPPPIHPRIPGTPGVSRKITQPGVFGDDRP